jgi:hypothetical protein
MLRSYGDVLKARGVKKASFSFDAAVTNPDLPLFPKMPGFL